MTDHDEWLKTLPSKRCSSGVLFFDEKGNLLVVKPTYKDRWTLPGGVCEELESPSECALREVREELGVPAEVVSMLCVDYRRNDEKRDDHMHFIFDGGVLSDTVISRFVLPPDELEDWKFMDVHEAKSLLGTSLAEKLDACLQARARNTTQYLELGRDMG